ncbi:MAG: alkyl hydroperoxide reductase [Planctomycetota bacterium]
MSDTIPPPAGPRWGPAVLRAAAVYNLLWGAAVILLPRVTLGWLLPAERLEALDPVAFTLWQCIGMIVGVYGIGYWAAARDPLRHWPIVLVGFLGKVFGPVGFIGGVLEGIVPLSFGRTIIPNDLIWWAPFFLLLRAARARAVSAPAAPESASG